MTQIPSLYSKKDISQLWCKFTLRHTYGAHFPKWITIYNCPGEAEKPLAHRSWWAKASVINHIMYWYDNCVVHTYYILGFNCTCTVCVLILLNDLMYLCISNILMYMMACSFKCIGWIIRPHTVNRIVSHHPRKMNPNINSHVKQRIYCKWISKRSRKLMANLAPATE